MRQFKLRKRIKKLRKEYIRYVVVDKNKKIATTYRYKIRVSEAIGVSRKTLDRNMPYENDGYSVYEVKEVNY